MSPIGLILNLVLGGLLLAALVLGMRLERRLRALRDGHLSFTKSVAELDQAALRTESGLADLRATTMQAQTALAARIDQAQALATRLEQLIATAQAAADQPLMLSTPLATSMAKPAPRPMAPAAAPARPAAPSTLRSRVSVDDDLFEIGEPQRAPLSAMAGGRR